MNLDDVALGIAEALQTIPALKPYDYLPNQVTAPAAIVGLGRGQWIDMDEGQQVEVKVLVLASLATAKEAQKRLREVCASTGSYSVRAAIALDRTLGGTCDSISVEGWSEPEVYEIGGVEYLGVEFTCEVLG